MGLRDNFRQAAKELMDGPEAARPRSYPQPSPEPVQEETPMFVPEPAPAPTPTPAYMPEPEPVYVPEPPRTPEPPRAADPFFGRSYEPAGPQELTTIIAPGTIIRGSVESNTSMELYGEVQGDIVTTKDLKLKGKIQGNATGGNVELYSIHMVGNVTASGTAMLDSESEVEGDVTAESLILNGKIQGDVQVSKRLALEGSAVIVGRVAAERLSVDEGAIIQGEILIGKSVLPPKQQPAYAPPARPAAPAQAVRPTMPTVPPVQPRPAVTRPAAPKPPVAAPKAPVAPKAAAKPAPKAEEKDAEEKKED